MKLTVKHVSCVDVVSITVVNVLKTTQGFSVWTDCYYPDGRRHYNRMMNFPRKECYSSLGFLVSFVKFFATAGWPWVTIEGITELDVPITRKEWFVLQPYIRG